LSHWTKVSTKITQIDALKKALEKMGLNFSEGDHKITQYGTSENAELKLDDAVGLSRQKDGTFAMVGDFYHSNNSKLSCYYCNPQKFSTDLSLAYAEAESVLRLEEQEFSLSERTEDAEYIYLTFEQF
jgi:hypothetical protein